jgi:hypothetical protein
MADVHSELPTHEVVCARIREEWDALLAAANPLGDMNLTSPDAGGWSVLDNLAHVCEWEKFLLAHQCDGKSADAALGFPLGTLGNTGEAEWNALLWERNRGRTAESVLAELRAVHARLMAWVQRLSDADLREEVFGIGPDQLPRAILIINNSYDHYAEHRRTILSHS